MTNIPSKVTIPKPFASGGNVSTFGVESSTDVNFTDGFPAIFSSPKSNGGKYVQREDINTIGNLATVNEFFKQCGGFYTFDQGLCDHIGGYPKDAVLKYIFNGFIYDVISLKEHNTFDFNENGVDGVNWRIASSGVAIYPNYDPANTDTFQIIWDSTSVSLSNTFSSVSDNIVMPFDGYVHYYSNSTAALSGLSVGVVDGTTNGVVAAANIKSLAVPTLVSITESFMGMIMCVTSPDENGEAPDISVDLTNLVSGSRNCAVFHVEGMGMSQASAGAGIIPVRKGSKIKLFGQETFSKTFNSNGISHAGGSFLLRARLEAYKLV